MHVFRITLVSIKETKVLYMLTLGKVPFLQQFEVQDLQAKFLQSCRRIQTMTLSGTHPRKKYFVFPKEQVFVTSI